MMQNRVHTGCVSYTYTHIFRHAWECTKRVCQFSNTKENTLVYIVLQQRNGHLYTHFSVIKKTRKKPKLGEEKI